MNGAGGCKNKNKNEGPSKYTASFMCYWKYVCINIDIKALTVYQKEIRDILLAFSVFTVIGRYEQNKLLSHVCELTCMKLKRSHLMRHFQYKSIYTKLAITTIELSLIN